MNTTTDAPQPTEVAPYADNDMATQEEEEQQAPPPPIDCGVLSRYPVGAVLFFAAVGLGAGIGLSIWDPEDPDDKQTALQWVGLIGDLFLRGLQAVVLPLVVVNVILAIVDMMSNGQAGAVAGKMLGFYCLTGTLASMVALLYIVTFQGLFQQGDFEEAPPPDLTKVILGCGGTGYRLSHGNSTSLVSCQPNATIAHSAFVVQEIDTGDGTMDSTNSLSDTIYAGVFERLVTPNIVGSFIEANFAALVVFSVFFGIALAKTVILPQQAMGEESTVVKLMTELDRVFSMLIFWVLSVTPFAVMSLLAATIGAQNDLLEAFQNIALLMVAVILAMGTHYVIVYGGLYFFITQSNPVQYFYHLIPAQSTVFASASSVATIPVTLECVKETEKVPPAVSRLVVPLGAAINLDGGAIYFPIACIWLAVLNGLEPSAGDYVLLIILATVGSAGTASVPAASLVLIISNYNTVFGTTGAPFGFSFILAMDWLLDRCRATLNVSGDAMVCALVTKVAGLDAMAAMEEEKATESSTANDMEDGVLSNIKEERSDMGSSEMMEKEHGTVASLGRGMPCNGMGESMRSITTGGMDRSMRSMQSSSKRSGRSASSRMLATLAMDSYGIVSNYGETPAAAARRISNADMDVSMNSLGRSTRSRSSTGRYNNRRGSMGNDSMGARGDFQRPPAKKSASSRMMQALAMETYGSSRNIGERNQTNTDELPVSAVNKHIVS